MRRLIVLIVLVVALAVVAGGAEPPTRPADELLGDTFQSLAAGIAFRAPAGSRELRRPVTGDEVVQFVNESRKWVLIVRRILLTSPVPLNSFLDKQGNAQPGMLEATVQQFQAETPGAEVLRKDTIDLGEAEAGMVAARYSFGLETNLTQMAIIRAGDQQYYTLSLICPAPRSGNIEDDPGVQSAVETFRAVLDSVKLLDQTAIRREQDERLMRTRTLMVNFTEAKLRSVLQKEQWFRLIRDGKDIGYTYVVEEVARDLPRRGRPQRETGPEGVLVGVRSRTIPEPGRQVDAESWLFCTFDRKQEAWSSLGLIEDPKEGKITLGELGISRRRERPVADPNAGIGQRPAISLTEQYRLEVTRFGRNLSSEPIVRDLPPFYLPQALGQLLPRLVPRRQPQTYLFACYISDVGELVYRYIDVLPERDVNLGGKRYVAVPVQDRVGLEGAITTHYVSPEGQYLGSISEESKLTILPTDAASLEKLWNNANLTRPGEVNDQ